MPVTSQQEQYAKGLKILEADAVLNKVYAYRRLGQSLPATYIMINSAFLITIGLTCIGLQIALIVYSGPYYSIGSGIWGGLIAILIGIQGLLIALTKQYTLYLRGLIFGVPSVLGLFAGLVAVNIAAVMNRRGSQFIELNISILSLGLAAFVFSLVHFAIVSVILNQAPNSKDLIKQYKLLTKNQQQQENLIVVNN